jgi:3-phenylpropionate/trans-cinnamate dioxygenase ferredoxin reductase subunit
MPVADRVVDVLLVGGGVASARCARTLRRNGFDGSILIVGAEAIPPYNRPPLSKELLRDDLPDELVLAEPDAWYERRDVDLRLGAAIVDIDPVAPVAVLEDGTRIAFEHCLLAMGAEPRTLPIEGGEVALLLRTLSDSRALRARALEAGAGAAVTVIGGGFIGVEVASALATLGLRPTVVEMADRLWGGSLGAELGTWAVDRLRAAGIDVRLNAAVTRLDPGLAWIGDERLDHAFSIAGIGVRPRVGLAERAGLELDDGIVTDGAQRTSRPGIWAAGDVARVEGQRVEHWHAAREAGERVALSMLDLPVPPVSAPWLFSEVAGVSIDVLGSAAAWDEERWLRDVSVLAYLDGERVVQLAVIASAVDPALARALVERSATFDELREALDPALLKWRL